MSQNRPFREFYGTDSKFVYYNTLQDTHPSIYRSLVGQKAAHTEGHQAKMVEIASQLYALAAAEGAKEVMLLKQYFNVSSLNLSPSDMYSKEIGNQIVVAINEAISFKDAFERHMTRIVGKNGKQHAKITSAQFFQDYFNSALYKIVSEKIKTMDLLDYTLEQLGDELFSDEVIGEALEQTFFGTNGKSLRTSGDWSANDEKHGYEEMYSAIERFNKNSFLKEVAQAYDLQGFKERMMQQVKSQNQLNNIFRTKKSATSYLNKSLHQTTTTKGTLAEIIGEKAAAAAVNAIQGQGVKVDFSSKVIGGAGGKADIVMTFNADMSKILEVVDQHYKGRDAVVAAYKGLNQHLSKMKDGFVVYVNAKDYSLIQDKGKGGYYFQGFSAGEAISLKTLEGVIERTPGGSQEVIGQIMSTMSGAIWSDRVGMLEEILASKFAYLLFDDVRTIGAPRSGGQAIHLTLLDGIYIPLSYLFYLMADAINDVSKDARDIVDVDINSGSIKYPNPPWTEGMWADQKAEAYNTIKIGARFLKNFIEVISGISL